MIKVTDKKARKYLVSRFAMVTILIDCWHAVSPTMPFNPTQCIFLLKWYFETQISYQQTIEAFTNEFSYSSLVD